ncbi:uncharacterized protein BJ212DRAFT_1480163 [Suillus subaureus]|uniref:Uncharacterized protein n=1 Tax=Suillus subaureus TaxID=48587 RepID=A0A9P7ECE2_9AGAM|nr:uncharacterized protein BJ212DRAFT_1480163 [Suillus subaureus]KAG1817603.1 hypothetical protein BJ212DRAFT_1480163 [Suillus subaureus]
MSPDRKNTASAGLDAKVYVWSVEAVLKQQGGTNDANAKPDLGLKGHSAQPKQTNTRGLARYGNNFFGNDANHVPHYAPSESSFSLIRWRHVLGSIHFTTQPAKYTSTSITPAPIMELT